MLPAWATVYCMNSGQGNPGLRGHRKDVTGRPFRGKTVRQRETGGFYRHGFDMISMQAGERLVRIEK